MSIWVILEANFEYNDEVYATPEYEGGRPVVAYRNKEKAEEECAKKNIEKLVYLISGKGKYETLDVYGYSLVDVFLNKGIDMLEKHFEKSHYDICLKDFQSLPVGYIETLSKQLASPFYEVYEVDEVE